MLFNAQLALYRAQVEAEIRLVEARVRTAITQTELQGQQLEGEETFIRARAQLWNAEAGLMGGFVGAMGQILGVGQAALQEQLDALRAILASLPAAIDPGEIRIGGGGGGGRGQQRADFDEQLRGIIRSGVPDAIRALMDLQDQMTDLAAEARRLGANSDLTAEALRVLGEQLRAQAQEVFLSLGERMAEMLGDEEALARFREMRYDLERAQMLLQIRMLEGMAEALGITQEQIDELLDLWGRLPEDLQRPVEQVFGSIEDALAALAPPIDDFTAQLQRIAEALAYLESAGKDSEDAAKQAADALGPLRDQLLLTFGDRLLSFLDRYYSNVEGYEEFRMELERIRFQLELANMQAQFAILKAMGLVTDAMAAQIEGLFDWIASHEPTFSGGGTSAQTPGQWAQQQAQQAAQSAEDLMRDREEFAERLRDIMESELPDAERRWRELQREIADLATEGQRLGFSMQEIAAAQAVLIRNFWRDVTQPIKDFYDSLNLSDLSPLTTAQQFAVAQQEAFATAAAAQGGDLQAIQDLPGVLQQYLTLAAQQFGTAGAGYAGIFAWVQQIAELFSGYVGQPITLPPPPAAGQNTAPGPVALPSPAASVAPNPGGNAAERRTNELLAEQNATLRALLRVGEDRLAEERRRNRAA
jgi:hypothetical protein